MEVAVVGCRHGQDGWGNRHRGGRNAGAVVAAPCCQCAGCRFNRSRTTAALFCGCLRPKQLGEGRFSTHRARAALGVFSFLFFSSPGRLQLGHIPVLHSALCACSEEAPAVGERRAAPSSVASTWTCLPQKNELKNVALGGGWLLPYQCCVGHCIQCVTCNTYILVRAGCSTLVVCTSCTLPPPTDDVQHTSLYTWNPSYARDSYFPTHHSPIVSG